MLYRDYAYKKIWDGPVPSVALSLASIPAAVKPLAPAAVKMLTAIIRHTPVEIEEAYREDDGDWYRLESDDLRDDQIFSRLRDNWMGIAGRSKGEFAVLQCLAGDDRGVWLFHRKSGTGSRLTGCRRVNSLS
jgi:hypothetical protein